MISLTVNDIEKDINNNKLIDVNKFFDISHSIIVDNRVVRYIIYRYILRINKSLYNKLDNRIDAIKNKNIVIKDPISLIDFTKEFTHKSVNLMSEVKELNYFSAYQLNKIEKSQSAILKKMFSLEKKALVEIKKNKPRVDDSHLINLLIHNNTIELSKKF